MKKLFAILLVAILATSFAFADSWGSGTQTGTFNADVFCIPKITQTGMGGDLGNYFKGYVGAPLTTNTGIEWELTGPVEASYHFVSSTIVITGPTPAPILSGYIYLKDGNDIELLNETGTVPPDEAGLPVDEIIPGSDLSIDCDAEATGEVHFGAVITGINTQASAEGSFTWKITFTVTANI